MPTALMVMSALVGSCWAAAILVTGGCRSICPTAGPPGRSFTAQADDARQSADMAAMGWRHALIRVPGTWLISLLFMGERGGLAWHAARSPMKSNEMSQ